MSWLPGSDTRHGLLAWVVVFELLVFAIEAGIDLIGTPIVRS